MADFPNRPDELAKKYADFKKNMVTTPPAGSPAVVMATWGILETSIASYIDWREKALAEGFNYVRAGSDATGKDAQDKWKSFFLKQMEEAKKRADSFLSRPENKSLQEFIELTSLQETIFFSCLVDMPMAQFQGETRENIRSLKRKKDECLAEWSKIAQLDQQRDSEWATLRTKVLDESKKMVTELLGWSKKIADLATSQLPNIVKYLAKGVALVVGSPLDYQTATSIRDAIRYTMAVVNVTKPTLDDFVRNAQRLSDNRQTVITVFNNKRDDVQWILAQYNLDLVTRRYEELAGKTRDLAGKAGTSGAVDDAKKFADKIINESRSLIDEYKTCYNEFTSSLAGIFVGEPSSSTREQLAEASFFYQFMKDFAAIDIFNGYQETAANVAKIFNISLDSLDDANKNTLREYLRAEFSPLMDKVKEIDSGVVGRFKDTIDTSARLCLDKLRR